MSTTATTIKRTIAAGATVIVAFTTFAACGEDPPAGDIGGTTSQPTKNPDFTPKYGEHSDNFVKKGPATGGHKAPGDFQP